MKQPMRGNQDAVSLLVDSPPLKRMDLYAGVMISNVYGGWPSGFASTYYAVPGNTKESCTTARTQNWDPTIEAPLCSTRHCA
jgi:hypothetical protein